MVILTVEAPPKSIATALVGSFSVPVSVTVFVTVTVTVFVTAQGEGLGDVWSSEVGKLDLTIRLLSGCTGR